MRHQPRATRARPATALNASLWGRRRRGVRYLGGQVTGTERRCRSTTGAGGVCGSRCAPRSHRPCHLRTFCRQQRCGVEPRAVPRLGADAAAPERARWQLQVPDSFAHSLPRAFSIPQTLSPHNASDHAEAHKLTALIGRVHRTQMVACLSPAECDAAESFSTLRYAQRACDLSTVISTYSSFDEDTDPMVRRVPAMHALLLARPWSARHSRPNPALTLAATSLHRAHRTGIHPMAAGWRRR